MSFTPTENPAGDASTRTGATNDDELPEHSQITAPPFRAHPHFPSALSPGYNPLGDLPSQPIGTTMSHQHYGAFPRMSPIAPHLPPQPFTPAEAQPPYMNFTAHPTDPYPPRRNSQIRSAPIFSNAPSASIAPSHPNNPGPFQSPLLPVPFSSPTPITSANPPLYTDNHLSMSPSTPRLSQPQTLLPIAPPRHASLWTPPDVTGRIGPGPGAGTATSRVPSSAHTWGPPATSFPSQRAGLSGTFPSAPSHIFSPLQTDSSPHSQSLLAEPSYPVRGSQPPTTLAPVPDPISWLLPSSAASSMDWTSAEEAWTSRPNAVLSAPAPRPRNQGRGSSSRHRGSSRSLAASFEEDHNSSRSASEIFPSGSRGVRGSGSSVSLPSMSISAPGSPFSLQSHDGSAREYQNSAMRPRRAGRSGAGVRGMHRGPRGPASSSSSAAIHAASVPPAHEEQDLERKPYHPKAPSGGSNWVMWVGNMPNDATQDEANIFFGGLVSAGNDEALGSQRSRSGGATPGLSARVVGGSGRTSNHPQLTIPGAAASNQDLLEMSSTSGGSPEAGIESIFLILQSHCAFVNYTSELHLQRALSHFHGRPFRPGGVKLVCRVRRKAEEMKSGVGGQRGLGLHRKWVEEHVLNPVGLSLKDVRTGRVAAAAAAAAAAAVGEGIQPASASVAPPLVSRSNIMSGHMIDIGQSPGMSASASGGAVNPSSLAMAVGIPIPDTSSGVPVGGRTQQLQPTLSQHSAHSQSRYSPMQTSPIEVPAPAASLPSLSGLAISPDQFAYPPLSYGAQMHHSPPSLVTSALHPSLAPPSILASQRSPDTPISSTSSPSHAQAPYLPHSYSHSLSPNPSTQTSSSSMSIRDGDDRRSMPIATYGRGPSHVRRPQHSNSASPASDTVPVTRTSSASSAAARSAHYQDALDRYAPHLSHTRAGRDGSVETSNVSFDANDDNGGRSSPSISTTSTLLATYFPARYFVLKAMTKSDLQLSVNLSLWATQTHNEFVLDQAFRTSKDVYLVFGANKAGEFHGYAKMEGPILTPEKTTFKLPPRDESPDAPAMSPFEAHLRRWDSTLHHAITTEPGGIIELESALEAIQEENPRGSPTAAPHRDLSRITSPPLVDSPSPLVQSPPPVPSSSPSPLSPTSTKVGSGNSSGRGSSSHMSGGSGTGPRSVGRSSLSMTAVSGDSPAELNSPGTNVTGRGKSSEPQVPDLSPITSSETPDIDSTAGGIHSTNAVSSGPTVSGTEGASASTAKPQWGTPFKVQWISVQGLPFHSTRMLRNPWNKDREVKVSRDGTELEPLIGKQLLDLWDVSPSGSVGGGATPWGGSGMLTPAPPASSLGAASGEGGPPRAHAAVVFGSEIIGASGVGGYAAHEGGAFRSDFGSFSS